MLICQAARLARTQVDLAPQLPNPAVRLPAPAAAVLGHAAEARRLRARRLPGALGARARRRSCLRRLLLRCRGACARREQRLLRNPAVSTSKMHT